MKLLERLLSEGRLHSRPDVLFLDSAHEADETFMELQHLPGLAACYALQRARQPGGSPSGRE